MTVHTREDLIARWRCCAEGNCGSCPGEMELCDGLEAETIKMLEGDAAELQNKQRHIDSLLLANEGLRNNMGHMMQENQRLKEENERLHRENFWLSGGEERNGTD